MKNFESFIKKESRICVLGLGYVGLPLAVLLAEKFNVIGFDIDKSRINELNNNFDRTEEVYEEKLKKSSALFTHDSILIKEADIVIATVPTPIDEHKKPDLRLMIKASETIGKNLKKGAVVVYESTVYPGVTEDECVPVLEKFSGLKWKEDFFVGYSPERVNPGDKNRTIDKIVKVVSGDTLETRKLLENIYGAVVTAGIHPASDIKTAEAAKVIENTQRDLNIALMNELALIFDKMGLCTKDVLAAAGTKWNFLPFEPGLVGGHCIGVDPYYLTYKAEELGYNPNIILAGRRINDNMGKFIAEKLVKLLISSGGRVKGAKVLVCGITFKENCPDIRNTRVTDIIAELREYGLDIDIFDPVADSGDVMEEYGLELVSKPQGDYEAVVLAVKHKAFENMFSKENINELLKEGSVFIDVKSFIDKSTLPAGVKSWSL